VDEAADFVIDNHAKQSPEKLVVHCLAGIGRTGTTIALVNMVIQLKLMGQNAQISPFSTVRQLREQRIYMCQTEN